MQERSTHQIKFRVNNHELERLQKESNIHGASLSELAKNIALKRLPTTILLTNQDAKSIMLQLQKIGTNVNQMAKHLNSGIREGFHEGINQAVEQLKVIRQYISGAYGHR